MTVRYRRVTPAIPGVAGFLFPSLALAQDVTIGQRISAAMSDMVGPLLFVVSLLCALGGIVLLARGLMKLKDSGTDRSQLGGALTTIVAATLLIALPEAAGIGMSSVMGTSGLFGSSDLMLANDALDGNSAQGKAPSLSQRVVGMSTVTSPQDCLNMSFSSGGATNGGPVPCMAGNLAKNVVPVGVIAVFAFVFLAGLWGFGSALFELARSHGQEGRGTPPGWWGRIAISVFMMNGPPIFMAVSKSIIGAQGDTVGTNGVQVGSSLLTYNISGATVFAQYQQLIGHVFTILVLFGVIAFVRGLFILKGATEQRGNATFSHGVVYMVAGILLANSKLSTCAVMGTIQGVSAAQSMGFCQ